MTRRVSLQDVLNPETSNRIKLWAAYGEWDDIAVHPGYPHPLGDLPVGRDMAPGGGARESGRGGVSLQGRKWRTLPREM